ncbi:response regulator [Magnetospirillum aberrantis]|uniref:Response regulator transcription factor n=1 Tax=Magnetospirillum aberrantis SpK TaxID=908842 RepID=A0A7C9QV85_9PROT|nr:response regulator [Magnetospirillum aberrantis]NFV81418.1 response regulator transcription factor [Magnetospirillum aberrantis SpK]
MPHPIAEPQPLVLIAEDEPEIADILSAYLQRNGLRSVHAADGRRALDLHLSLKPDLIVLDVQMPQVDGWQVLAAVRHRGDTPVIMLTALDQDMDKLMGLRIGADDYVVKPFNPAEVVARIQAVLRRARPGGGQPVPRFIRLGRLQADLENHEIAVQDEDRSLPLLLTLTEFKLLVHLMRAPRRVFGREELLVACLPEGEALERTVDSHVSKLRKKLEAVGLEGVPASVRGVGYRLGDVS